MSKFPEFRKRSYEITNKFCDQIAVCDETKIKQEITDEEKTVTSKTNKRLLSKSIASNIFFHLDINPSPNSSSGSTPSKKFSKRRFDDTTPSDSISFPSPDFSDKNFKVSQKIVGSISDDDFTPKKHKQDYKNKSFSSSYFDNFDKSSSIKKKMPSLENLSQVVGSSSSYFQKRNSGGGRGGHDTFDEDEKFSFLSPLSKSFSHDCTTRETSSAAQHKRFSERFIKDRSFLKKRHSIGDPMNRFSQNRRRFSTGESIFEAEFKSTNFIHRLDTDGLRNARNTLQFEVNSEVPFVDTHCHFDFLFKRLNFKEDVDKYFDETFFKFPSNFEGCIADWCQPSLYGTAPKLLHAGSEKFKLWAAFGCHPHFVSSYNDVVEKTIERFIENFDSIIAWGEMGLDYSDRFGQTDHELQKRVFIRQLDRARRRNLPIVIHCRDADPDLIEIMKTYVPHDTKIHRHCLTTEEKDVHELLEHFPNCYVGFTNLLTNRSAYRPRDAASKIPLDRILLETDSPYFIPRCVTSASKGAAKWSHPGMASSVACELAYIKNIRVSDVLKTIRDNVYNLYGI